VANETKPVLDYETRLPPLISPRRLALVLFILFLIFVTVLA
jgi:hypothetical protein